MLLCHNSFNRTFYNTHHKLQIILILYCEVLIIHMDTDTYKFFAQNFSFRPTLMAVWALPLIASCLSITTTPVRIPPEACEKVASDLGLGGGFHQILLHQLQLASHNFATIWQKIRNSLFKSKLRFPAIILLTGQSIILTIDLKKHGNFVLVL